MVTIVADTTSTLSVAEANSLGVPYLPQVIIFGEESYRDDGEINTETFLRKLKESPTLPKTSAPPPSLYTPIFEEILARGDSIVVVAPSTEMSGTYRSATTAAQEFPGADIHVVDTRTIAAGLGVLVRHSVKWAKEGLSPEKIVENIHALQARERVYFYVDTLEYLHKGGRIGGATMLVGSILQIKPLLCIRDGIIQPLEQQRTKKRATTRLIELITKELPKKNDSFIHIMQGGALEDAHWFAEQFKEILGVSEIPIVELPPAIIVHTGPGVMGFSFFVDPE